MLDGSTLEVADMHAYLSCQVEYINCLSENLRHPSCTLFVLGIASHLSWFQCLSSICIVKVTFNTSPRSRSKWHIYSYIPINKDQLYSYQCTAKPCQVRPQFWLNSTSFPLNVFSDVTLKCFYLKNASFGNTVKIKVQKQYTCMCRLGHYMRHPIQPISYVPLVPYHC